jgi:RNA polymerase sigma-70 factor (ECF subfamily)
MGEEAAFETLIERHQSRVIGTVAKMLGTPEGAEDIAQQVFLRVWHHASRYRPEAKFTTWLLTITRNLVFNEFRKRQRTSHLPLENEDGTPRDFSDPQARGAAKESEERELQEAIDRAMADLPEQQRLALVLRRYEAMPYEEIASVLGTSVSSVKSLLFRAREQLRCRLKPFLEED